MSPQDPHPDSLPAAERGALEVAGDQAEGVTTATVLVTALLERIAGVDSQDGPIGLRSVLAVHPEAEDQARALDVERAAGRLRGPLHGIPVLVKDNLEALGLPGTAGSLALVDRQVAGDSPAVARLRAAGAVILGATNLSEWANLRSPRSTSGWSAVGGLTGNPWALDRSAGGSSSGSGAAVAARLAPLAVGTETNGSITCPASLNGVVGIKPTVGSVPTTGVVPISASQDVPGPLARSVRDAALLLEVLAGIGGLQEACSPEAALSLRVGVAEGWLTGDPATDAVFARAIDLLTGRVAGIRGVPVLAAPGDVDEDQGEVLFAELRDDLGAYLAGRSGPGVRSLAEVIAFNRVHAEQELAHFGQEYLERAEASGGRGGQAYAEARRRNLTWARDACMGPALDTGIDVLISPAYRPAWKSDLVQGDVLMGGGAVCTPPAILGWPILTLPMGFVDGLPVGLSVVGPAGSERLLVAVGQALETALGLAGTPALQPAWRPPQRG